MNPKDMTKEELMTCLAEDWDRLGRTAFSDKFWDGGRLQQRVDDYKAELFRRLVEADALRKENDALLKDKYRIDFLDDGNYGIDPRNIPGVMMNGRRFHCLAGRGDWSSLRDAIDAARLAKESEASHE